MDNLQPYQIAPHDGASNSPPYDPTQYVEDQATQFLGRYAPPKPEVSAYTPAPGSGGQESKPGGKWDQLLQSEIKKKGQKFTAQDFDALAGQFRSQAILPFVAGKGMSTDNAQRFVGGFDSYAQQQRRELFGDTAAVGQEGQEGVATPGGPDDVGATIEFGANVLGGALKTIPGIIALADYGLRAIPGIDGRTAVGDIAAGLNKGIDKLLIDPNTSEATRQQQRDIQEQIAKDPSLENVIAQYLGHGRNLAMMTASGLGSLVPGVGTAAGLSKLAKAAKAVDELNAAAKVAMTAGKFDEVASLTQKAAQASKEVSRLSKIAKAATATKFRQTASVAAGAGVPASGTQGLDLEKQIQDTKLEDLLADNPRNQAVFNASKFAGLSDAEAEKKLKEHITGEALKYALPAYLAGNFGLELVPGLNVVPAGLAKQIFKTTTKEGLEKLVQAGVLRSLARGTGRVIKGGVAEGSQEGGAGALQTIGENYGQSKPLTEGLTENIVQNAIPGALIGGIIHPITGRHRTKIDKDGNIVGKETSDSTGKKGFKKQTSQAPAGPANAPPSAPATTPPTEGETAATGPYEAPATAPLDTAPLATLNKLFDTTLREQGSRIKRIANTAETPSEVISLAETKARSIAGEAWSTLDIPQRVDAVEKVVTAMQEQRSKKPIEGLGEAFTEYKNKLTAPTSATVTETPLTESDIAPVQEAPVQEAPVQEAPVQEAPVQEAPRKARKTVKKAEVSVKEATEAAKYREKIATEFGEQAKKDSLGKKGKQVKAHYEKLVADREKQRKTPPKKSLKKAKAVPIVDTSTAFLNNYLAYLADKPLLVDPAYGDVIKNDSRLDDVREAYKDDKIHNIDELKAFLEKNPQQRDGTTKIDRRLTGHILGDRQLGKYHPAKEEARRLYNALKSVESDKVLKGMTLADLRRYHKKAIEIGLIGKTPPKKSSALKKAKKEAPKKEPTKKATRKSIKKKAKPKQEEAPSPKEQAPEKEGATPKRNKKPKTVEEKVAAHFSKTEELGAEEIRDLTDGVYLAQQGDDSSLTQLTSALVNDGVITKEDRRALFAWGREKPKTVREISKEELNELIDTENTVGDEQKDLNRAVPKTDQEKTEKFKKWSGDAPVLPLDMGSAYLGGPAVFTALHGSTFSGIEKFDNNPEKGTERNYLGKGAYFTTSIDDAATNYAGEGPDLKVKLAQRAEEIASSMEDDESLAENTIVEYLEAENPDVLDSVERAFRRGNLDSIYDDYLQKAAAWQAARELKGDNEGNTYKLYVRLNKPFNEANGTPLSEVEAEALMAAFHKVSKKWHIDARSVANFIETFVPGPMSENTPTPKDFIDTVYRELQIFESPTSDNSGPGQFIQEIVRETGNYDGIVMDAGRQFTRMDGVTEGTLHIVPFEANQIKSAISNNGEFSAVDDRIQYATRTPKQVAENQKLHMAVEEEFNETLESLPPLSVRGRIAKIMESVRKGTYTSDQALQDVAELHKELEERALDRKMKAYGRGRVRGVEWVRSKLNNLLRSANDTQRESINFAIWLLDQNPDIANDLAISVRELKDGAGQYSPLARLLTINRSDFGPRTVVHEILHHSERLLPTSIQERIRKEYFGRLLNKDKQIARMPDGPEKDAANAYIEAVIEHNLYPNDTTQRAAIKALVDGKLNVNEYYKYLSPSEYWAEEGSNILSGKHKADSWQTKAKVWLKEFIQRVKGLLGSKDSNREVLRALDQVLKSSGIAQSDQQIAQLDTLYDINESEDTNEDDPYLQTEEEARPDVKENRAKSSTDVSLGQRFLESQANSVYAFEQAVVDVNKANGVVTVDTDPTYNYRRYNSDVSTFNGTDQHQVVAPVVDWMRKSWAKYTYDQQTFLDAVNKFFSNKNFLERINTEWVLGVPLDNGAEATRIDIEEDMREGKLSPAEAMRKQTALAKKHAAMDAKEYALSQGMSEAVYDSLQRELDSLAESGITEEVMAELNELADPVRQRLRQRLVESGAFPENDPWVDYYGWKWYVPLKGAPVNANDIVSQNAFDMIPTERLSLAKLNKQLVAMEGRKTYGYRPFERLVVDLARAGERAANNNFMETLYNLVLDNKETLGANIKVFNGTPKDGYYDVTDEEQTIVKKLKPKNVGFVYGDGDRHYIVSLPKNSQLARGLILMNNVSRPNWFLKQVSKPTNGIARLYTTLSPLWQTFVGFARDITTIPLTVAVEHFDSPLQAGKFLSSFSVEMLQAYKALPTFMSTMLDLKERDGAFLGHEVKALARIAEENPEGYAAYLRRYLEGGGANDFALGFDLAGVKKIFGNAPNARISNFKRAASDLAESGGREGKIETIKGLGEVITIPWDKALDVTNNYANFLENITRVAAFKTLVKTEGMSDKEAAIRVRQVLDYQQSGLHGRQINSFLAFYRVGMTSIDTMRRVFRNKQTGKFDGKKFANWTIAMSGVSAAAYLMMAAMLGTDDDGKDKIKKIRANTLTQKMFFPIGDKVYGVNIGLGLPQMMMAPGILASAVANGHITFDEAIEEYYNVISRNGPFRLSGMRESTPTDIVAATYLGATPTILAPEVSLYNNLDTFDRPIHTTFRDDTKPNFSEGRSGTAPVYAEVAKFLYDKSGGKIDYYPEDIKYLVTNYFGQNAGDILKGTVDLANKKQLGLEEEYNPLTARAEVKDADYYDTARLYKLLDQSKQVGARYSTIEFEAKQDGKSNEEAKAEALKVLSKNPDDEAVVEAVRRLKSAQRKHGKEVRKIRRDKLLSVARKQALRKQADSDLRKSVDALEEALKNR